MTFETSQLLSFKVASGKKITTQLTKLSEGSRYTLRVKNNATDIVAELVSLLNSQNIH